MAYFLFKMHLEMWLDVLTWSQYNIEQHRTSHTYKLVSWVIWKGSSMI